MNFPNCLQFRNYCFLLLLGLSVGQASEWQQGDGYRWMPQPTRAGGKVGFTRLDPEAIGISFTNLLGQERMWTNQIYLNGSGVALGDVDGDGWCDIYFCGLDSPNKLLRNLGNWRFQDITAAAGVACPELACTGAVLADLDGDGDLDLLVNAVAGGTHCFLNDGKAQFADVTAIAGLASGTGSMSMALADVDGDGDLDLYVANYRNNTLRDEPNTRFSYGYDQDRRPVLKAVNGVPVTAPELRGRFTSHYYPDGRLEREENGEEDAFYLNDGKGKFSRVPFTGGAFLDEEGKPIEVPYDWGLSVMFRDLNRDGAPDIYVCNDFQAPDRIWINDGHGRFRAIRKLALRKTSLFSMGIDFADIDRDGHDDFFVADMLSLEHKSRLIQVGDVRPTLSTIGQIDNRPQVMRNTVQLNRGDDTFAEIAYYAGLESSEWSWTPAFLDVDLDGYEDLLVTTGHGRDAMNLDIILQIEAMKKQQKRSALDELRLRRLFPPLNAPNLAFRNRGDLTFEEVSASWGFHWRGVSHGLALADLDNDGDLDIVINNLNEAPLIYRNDSDRPSVAVRLKGLPPNTRGVGARIEVKGGPVPQSQEVICGGRYLSGDDTVRVFAAGRATNRFTIEVSWRSGKRSVVEGVKANHIYEIDETLAETTERNAQRSTLNAQPFFQEVSHWLNHSHHEELFDDFQRQPLLSRRLSQLGPGVAWFDFDGDGWEDLAVGSGRGGTLALFHNERGAGFKPVAGGVLEQKVVRDQTALVGLHNAAGEAFICAGSANYEDGAAQGGAVIAFDPGRQTAADLVPGEISSIGALTVADLDADGDLDLFAGGRVVPARYPEGAVSRIFRQNAGRFELDVQNTSILAGAGLVSGAAFSDLDGDGFPELILACEWGPVRVFQNSKGILSEKTQALGLANELGWWNGVATGDFDGDGRLDIIASNWGLNTRYRCDGQHPRRLYYGDLDGNGTIDIVEAYVDPMSNRELPDRGLKAVRAAMPFLQESMQTFTAYASADLRGIYGPRLDKAKRVEVQTLATTLFLNRGDHFEKSAFPREAQFAPAFALCVADYDGDGQEDIFLSQNFFAVHPDLERYDAGRGLWLRGNGQGGFTAVPSSRSGAEIYGEQRGAAAADFDGDGRVDLVVTQNGAATRLYHNRGGKPGLRVRLNAGPGNPTGIGASMRLMFGQRTGPSREVQAGAGYWSQAGAVQVLATPEIPTGIRVRWPGGRETTSELPAGAKEVLVTATGEVKTMK